MRIRIISLAATLALASACALAQSAAAPAARPPGKLTQEQIADTNSLRALVKATPALPAERICVANKIDQTGARTNAAVRL